MPSARFEENLATMRETPYSRYPVYRGSDSDVLGVLEVKTLLDRLDQAQPELFRKLRPAVFVSESTHALKLLEIFREEQQSLALVVDEYGDITGMVTLNDLMGAVLGRMQSGESADAEALVVDPRGRLAAGGWFAADRRPARTPRRALAARRGRATTTTPRPAWSSRTSGASRMRRNTSTGTAGASKSSTSTVRASTSCCCSASAWHNGRDVG